MTGPVDVDWEAISELTERVRTGQIAHTSARLALSRYIPADREDVYERVSEELTRADPGPTTQRKPLRRR